MLVLQSSGHQLLSYDTTFQLRDFYLSTLTFRHTLFKEDLVISVAFLLHKRKQASCHQEFFDVCCKLIPALKTTNRLIVTDKEQAYVKVISKCMPAAPHLRCWNHVQAAERWLHRHGATSDDMVVYRSDLKGLLYLPTESKITQKQLSIVCLKNVVPIF